MVVYETTNSYLTLNQRSQNTKNIWFVCHGMGYLSKYFIKYFNTLNTEENYIIAPQAPSKYYLNDDFKHVGASWLTREDTQTEITNVMQYLNVVSAAEGLQQESNPILFGFSQGVSIAMRWLVRTRISCSKVVLYAGSIPNEIRPEDLEFMDYNKTTVLLVYGNRDKYLTPERMENEKQKIEALFGDKAETIVFDGGHEIKPDLLQRIVSSS